jgi:hypothetical protein
VALKDLPEWLMTSQGFTKKLSALTIHSVAGQFKTITQFANKTEAFENDMGYMLTCASVLAHSSSAHCQDAALRIAQYCLSDTNATSSRKDGAALILDALANRATINLAEVRQFLHPNFEERLPASAQLEAARRRILYTIELADHTTVIANKFQAQFWDQANTKDWLSVSAPTSVGKSFILEVWIQDYLARNSKHLVVYLVPTRALISEVETDLRQRIDPEGSGAVNIATLPLAVSYESQAPNIMVFTQERFHIFLNAFETPPPINVLVVDEAHKVGDGYRGVFLQQVIESTSRLNINMKVIFASPFTSNPETLIEDAPNVNRSSALISTDVTVNQNLIWVNQSAGKPKKWNMSLCLPSEIVEIGTFNLENSPSPQSKRLPFVAIALSNGGSGNIIYENGAAAAERTSRQLFDCLPLAQTIDHEIAALIELCDKTIHKNFLLNHVLRRGIAFHYGNMPLLVKSEIERLFSSNKIHYLVCTSTLVEGVNMSCKNIFVRGPTKGRQTKMAPADFWNLAGRAGRWGKEFQGNVICIDTNNAAIWKDGSPPRSKSGVHISRTTDEVIKDIPALLAYIASADHLELSAKYQHQEHVFSYLSAARAHYGTLKVAPFLQRKDPELISVLDDAIAGVLSKISFPTKLIERNPGISPLLMESLFQRFSVPSEKSVERFLLADPGSDDALASYTRAFTRIAKHLSPKLGFTYKQAYIRALLVVKWIRGFPLSRLITDRIKYCDEHPNGFSEARIIRDVMNDVEEIARYQAPRLLACYNDVLGHFLKSIGRHDLQLEVQDLSLFLELGLNQQTQISLVGMGLSRTAAVMLSELIARDNLTQSECAAWISNNDQLNTDLPKLVQAEIIAVLQRYLLKIKR